MHLRAGNVGPDAGFMVLATSAAVGPVGANGGHVDVSVPLLGAQPGDTPFADIVPTVATAGLLVAGATVLVADAISVRVINATAAPITADIGWSILLLHTGTLAP